MSADHNTTCIIFFVHIIRRTYLTNILLWYWQEDEAAAADARPNLHSKLKPSLEKSLAPAFR
jgi:hypothetical protein